MIPFLEDVRQALDLPQFDSIAAQAKMKPEPRSVVRPVEQAGEPRLGAVLLLLFHRHNRYYFVLTRRREDLAAHAGQIALPGGRREDGESLQETALREAKEEVGIDPEAIEILGRLESIYILPSDFEVHPFVGWYLDKPVFVPQLSEVAEIIEAPVRDLFDKQARREEIWERQGISLQVPYFQIGTHKVWGATAMMLSEFAERLRLSSNGNLAAL